MRKRTWTTIILVLLFLVGLSLVLYPTFSEYWNANRQSRAVAVYVEEFNSIDEEERAAMLQEAKEYNSELSNRSNPYTLPDKLRSRYGDVLNATENGVMGYVDIPAINVLLPIYHGTDEGVLQLAVGHLEWTYLPVGGEGTHAVISGHRGLPSSKLFSDLDRVVVGDLFMLQVLDETLTYEVDQILIVEPDNVTALVADPGKDYCTLVTCTPYAVNTHRLLVRGHRIENIEAAKSVRIISEAVQIEPLIVAVAIGVPMVLLMLIWIMIADILRSRREKRGKNRQ